MINSTPTFKVSASTVLILKSNVANVIAKNVTRHYKAITYLMFSINSNSSCKCNKVEGYVGVILDGSKPLQIIIFI